MTNKEKLELLKDWLRENNVPFKENYFSNSTSTRIDLAVINPRIAVHMSDGNDQKFFQSVRFCYAPFFIRENETMDFILEKMQNCIVEQMMKAQKRFEQQQLKKEANEKKKSASTRSKAKVDNK